MHMAEPSYQVIRPQPATPRRSDDSRVLTETRERDPLRPRAVFVAHGMGQQVPFETLDDMARGLCVEIERRKQKVKSRNATTVRIGCETLQRLELELANEKDEPLPPIHLYEAYWAPLTEGVIGLWQTVRFLLSGGWNGLRSDARLHRFMFGAPRMFKISRRDLAWLFVVIATVISLLVIGGTIGTVAVARFMFEGKGWVNPELVRDLTTLFEQLLGVIAASVAVAVILVAVSRVLLKRSTAAARFVSMLAAVPAVPIVAAMWFTAYIAIPVIFMFDETAPFVARDCIWCTRIGWGKWIAGTAACVHDFVMWLLACGRPEQAAWWVLIGTAIVVLIYALQAQLGGAKNERGRGGRPTAIVLALAALGAILAICSFSNALAFVSWLLLFGAVLFVRSFLIQFVGDVAIYVSPHMVDQFFDLRARIKTVVWRAARAVYACIGKDGELLYHDVIVAGHSLGSVVVYDVLNRLINEDDLSRGASPECCNDAPNECLDVENRTKLLLTFGSPLDKTAFIFARHDPHGGSERDALAASVQPLIARERAFPWINVWTPFDILGGPLDFYDTPVGDSQNPNLNRVDNPQDPLAITPIMGHVEFWKNTLIYEKIYDALS
jgi:hypothetical protein